MLYVIIILLLLNTVLLLQINSKLPKRDFVAEALERDRLRRVEQEKS